MKVLVFGGAGFLGSYVVDALVERGLEVAIFDRKPSRFAPAAVRATQGDLLDKPAVERAVKGFDVVYNFAGLADLNASIDRPADTVTLNVLGNLNVLEACRAAGVKRFVYASSVYVFSNKGAFYGASKKASELFIEEYSRQYGLEYTIVRYGSVYGERADETNRIYRLLRDALTQKKITFLGDGTEEREYIHGRDAAKLSVDVLDAAYKNTHVVLTGVERFRYDELLEMMREIVGGGVEVVFLSQEYKGHYHMTPYSFSPTVGKKLVNNPSVDFGQGLLECVDTMYRELGLGGSGAAPEE
jgi:UDP-glucose 4-epimerase